MKCNGTEILKRRVKLCMQTSETVHLVLDAKISLRIRQRNQLLLSSLLENNTDNIYSVLGTSHHITMTF